MSNIEVQCVQGADAVAELRPVLDAHGLLPTPMYFMDPDYLAAGLEGENPSALLAWRDGRLIAYMPFVVRRQQRSLGIGSITLCKLPYQQMRLLGYRSVAEDDGAIIESFFAYLNDHWKRKNDIAMISDVPAPSPLADFLTRLPKQTGLKIVQRVRDSHRITLRGTFDEYLRTNFTHRARYNTRKRVRTFEDASLGTYVSAEDVDAFLSAASEVAAHTYQMRRGFDAIDQTPQTRRKVLHLAQSGKLRSYVLFANDVPCAYCFGVVHARTFHYEIVGYDERMAKMSPGTVLLYRILQNLFEAGVADELDFGVGDAEYKRVFGNTHTSVIHAEIYHKRPYSQLLFYVDTVRRWAMNLIRQLIGRCKRARSDPPTNFQPRLEKAE